MLNVSKLSSKRTVTGQNSGELYTKKHRRGNSKSLGKPLQSLLEELYPNFIGRISQVKGQSNKLMVLTYYSVLFYKYKKI
jgi:hypothetical protein